MRIRTFLDETEIGGYLAFTAVTASNIKFTGTTHSGGTLNQLQYSLNNGTTWNSLADDTYVPLSMGDTIMFRGECVPVSSASIGGIGTFSATGGTFSASGNVMSLLFGDDFADKTSLSGKTYAFLNLFNGCTGLVGIDNLILPATTLATYCYSYMFRGCTGLTTLPSGLLPATTLANYCYQYMFNGCTGLTTAPDLPATKLKTYCYSAMFSNCAKLNYVKCLATNISATNCTTDWLKSVASSGVFWKDSSMSSWTRGESGIPSGWTVQNA